MNRRYSVVFVKWMSTKILVRLWNKYLIFSGLSFSQGSFFGAFIYIPLFHVFSKCLAFLVRVYEFSTRFSIIGDRQDFPLELGRCFFLSKFLSRIGELVYFLPVSQLCQWAYFIVMCWYLKKWGRLGTPPVPLWK